MHNEPEDPDCWVIYVGPIGRGMTAMATGPHNLEEATQARAFQPIIPVPPQVAEYEGQVVRMKWYACLDVEPDEDRMVQIAMEAAGV